MEESEADEFFALSVAQNSNRTILTAQLNVQSAGNEKETEWILRFSVGFS